MCYWHVGSSFSVGAVSLDHKHDVFEAATLNSSWDSFSEFRTALAELAQAKPSSQTVLKSPKPNPNGMLCGPYIHFGDTILFWKFLTSRYEKSTVTNYVTTFVTEICNIICNRQIRKRTTRTF